jgi:putative membrane-bound dehydrogenase-like protein
MDRPDVKHARTSLALAVLLPFAVAALADTFPEPHDTEKSPDKPLPAEEAARKFRVPDGFSVHLFAAEPTVRNPLASAWDGRGRLWVAENFTYAAERGKPYDLSLRDRVLIFTDRGGKQPPERRVFIDTVQRLTSVEVGQGGVWLMCPPQLLFIPSRNLDVPNGPPQVVLEGFTIPTDNYHTIANGLRWGPDGWLYGRCGCSSVGRIRRPETGPETAIPLEGGVWRYHPKTKVFEPLSHGTTNPWGHDWDAHGEGFFVNTVIGHLWHLIPGAHYRRSATIDPNPLVYEPMEMHADHWHWDTGRNVHDQKKVDELKFHDSLGGGHAHCGCMIYLGEQWPEAHRGKLFTLNLHGRRANVERLERHGTGYVGRHEPDMLFAADPFFRGLELSYGPDGSVFMLDWSDTGECHEYTGVHRNSGRIFKVCYGPVPAATAVDIGALTEKQLVELHTRRNEWYVRQARRELADRAAAGQALTTASPALLDLLKTSADGVIRLRALWSLHTLGRTSEALLWPLLDDGDEHMRAWALRLLTDAWPLDTVMSQSRAENVHVPPALFDRFVRLAREDRSGLVRLVLASTLQRLPVTRRPALAAALLARAEDADDHNQPFLVWYGLLPVALQSPEALVPLAAEGRFPQVRQWIAHRFGDVVTRQPALIDALLKQTADKPEAVRRDVILGMTVGLAGLRKASAPPSWKTYPKEFTGADAAALRVSVQGLDAVFGDGRALDEVRRLALDDKAELRLRKTALETLIDARPPDLREVCEKLLEVRFLNTVALQGLTRFDDPAIARHLVKNYRRFHQTERPALVEALASRPAFAGELLDAVGGGAIPREAISAFQARQIRSFNKPELTAKLLKVWGELRDSPKDKTEQIAKLKSDLTASRLTSADRARGRAVFAKTCATCHRLFGTGEEVGPDLTGAQRKDIDYLLTNIVDPSAVVAKDFQMTILGMADGRVINGIVVAETERALTLRTAQAKVVIAKEDVEDRKLSPLSLMPDGLLQALSEQQVRDLIAYLMTDKQVDLPAGDK